MTTDFREILWDFFKQRSRLMAMAGLMAFSALGAGESQEGDVKITPRWRVDEADCRISFNRDASNFILTRVPLHITNRYVAAVAAYSGATALTNDVVFNDGKQLTVLIDARPARKKRARVDLYLIAGDKPVEPSDPPLRDPEPLYGCAARTAGMDFPATREQADSLTTRFDRSPKCFQVASFDDLGGTFKSWYSGNWQRKNHLVDLQSWLLVPKSDRYLFGVAGTAPAWLDINSTQVVEHPAFQPFDKFTAGEPVQLNAGVHRLRIRTVCRAKIDTGVAWKREGEEETASDVVMVTGADLSEGRRECRDRSVHPCFTYTAGASYRFRGVETLFVPYTFEDNSSCWSGSYALNWNIAGEDRGSNAICSVTLPSTALPARAELTVKAENGESEQYAETISYGDPVWSEYDVTTRISGIPAACYADDRIHPIVGVRTSGDDKLVYQLESEVELVSGKKILRSDTLQTAHGRGNQYLSQFSAGSLVSIRWSLKHCGCKLSSGRVLFQRDPVGVVPEEISGELFKNGDDFLSLIVSRQSAEREVVARDVPYDTRSVMLLDGFIFDDQSAVPTEWEWWSVAALELSPNRSGSARLQVFTTVSNALTAGTVIYAPALSCVADEGGTAGFERRLAAMCGVLTHGGGSAPRLILVAPPPFGKLPGFITTTATGESADAQAPQIAAENGAEDNSVDARRVAEIIVRVADVYGVETIDLYTAFEIERKMMGESLQLIQGRRLIPAGRELAARIIERKLQL
jgi:hypothetical protein